MKLDSNYKLEIRLGIWQSLMFTTRLWITAQAKEVSEDLRKRAVDARQAGKGYETIMKEFGQEEEIPLSGTIDQQRSLQGRGV